MKTIALNAVKLFAGNKSFFYIITIQPIFVFLLMSFLLPYSTMHNIAVIDQSIDMAGASIVSAIEGLEGVKVIDADAKEVKGKLMSGNIELAVIVRSASDVQMLTAGNSEIEGVVSLCVEQASAKSPAAKNVEVNEAHKKGLDLTNSLGFMIYKTLTSGTLLAGLIINERNKKMKDRILLSGTGSGAYLGGLSLIYLFFMMISSVTYYLAALVLRFDFGMRNSICFLMILFAANILSTSLYLFVSTVAKKEEDLWLLATFILTPMGLFAGVLFPYKFMPEWMQKVGSFFPHRWIAHAIEAAQKSGSMAGAIPDIILILGVSVILFIIASRRSTLRSL